MALHEDPLSAATGCLLALAMGLAFWLVVTVVLIVIL
jgi:hypothetical protein